MATRLYFVANTAPPVSPAYTADFVSNAQAVRRTLARSQSATTETRSGALAGTADDEDLIVQFVSLPLDGDQTVSGTATIVTRGRELAGTDNINSRPRAMRVVKPDMTDRGVLEAYTVPASTTELSTSLAGQQHMTNGGITSVSALSGDRIVVEVGYRESGTGTAPNWEMVLGGSGTDHGSAANNDTTGTVPWLEFSANLVFKDEHALGQVTETETAQVITPERDVAVAQATETETAQVITPTAGETIVPLGQVLETETLLALTVDRLVALGLITSTETAQAVAAEKDILLGQTIETETAQAMGVQLGGGAQPVGDITGEDRGVNSYLTTGIAGVAVAGDLISIFAMTSATNGITATGKGGAAYTVRTDVTNSSTRMVHLTRVAEVDEPEATIVHAVSQNGACAGQVVRNANGFDAATDTTDSSLGTDTGVVLPNQVVSTNGSILLTGYCFRKGSVPDFTLAQASNHEELCESDSNDAEGTTNYSISCSVRNTGGGYGRLAGTYGGETFTTNAGTFTGRQIIMHAVVKSSTGTTQVPVPQAVETETAQAVVLARAAGVSQALSTETSQSVTVQKTVALGQVTEVESAQVISASAATLNVPVLQVLETESAQGLTPARRVNLNQVTETETPLTVAPTGGTPLRVGLWRNKNDPAGTFVDTGTWRTKLNRDIAIFDGNFDGPWSHYLANGSTLPSEVVTAYSQGHDILLFHKGAAGLSWAQLGTSAGDANWDALAASIVANIDPGRPIIYTFHHEPENDQDLTVGSGMTPADYIAAWRRVHARFTAAGVGTRVRYQMTYMNSHSFTPSRMEALWPTLVGSVNFIDIVSQQSYIACTSSTNIATKHQEDFQYLRDNRTATRQWSDLDGRKLAVSEWGMDLGGVWCTPCTAACDRGTDAHRALGFDRIRAQLQMYVDYHVEYLTLFNARTDIIGSESNTATVDAVAYQALILAMNSLAASPDQLHITGTVTETEMAQALGGITEFVALGQVLELEQAQALTGQGGPKTVLLNQVTEVEAGQAVDMSIVAPGQVQHHTVEMPDYRFRIDYPTYRFSPTPYTTRFRAPLEEE